MAALLRDHNLTTARKELNKNETAHSDFALAALLLTAIPLRAHAHEGMIHVIGIVTALTDKSVTVETTDKKSVDVVLADTTTYAKDKKGCGAVRLEGR